MIINILNCTASVVNDIKHALPRCKIEYESAKEYKEYNIHISGIMCFEMNDNIATIESMFYEVVDIDISEFYKIEAI